MTQKGTEAQKYALRGVSSSKADVHKAIENIDKGLFPGAFCKIVPDYLTGDPEYALVMHADGAGTKSSLAYAKCLERNCSGCSCNEHRRSYLCRCYR